MAYKDFYDILGVDKKTSDKEIKKAYRKLATQFHPDKTKGDREKEDRFKEISEAYQVLGNPEKRRQYDALGPDWEQFKQSGTDFDEFMEMKNQYKQRQQRYQGYSHSGGFGGQADFSDIFESFFGQGGPGYGDPRAAPPGADVSGRLSIGLQEAYTGTERILDVDGNKIKLKIKPGAYSGLKLRARGKGQQGGRGRAGDLYVHIDVERHPVYERKGDDLYMQANINMFDAILGGQLELTTLSGQVQVPVKEGTQNGKKLRLRGKGMPVYGKPGTYGDLFVTLVVELPTNLSPDEKTILKDLKKRIKEKV